MATPPNISAALAEYVPIAGTRLSGSDTCVGAKFHSPSPLMLREVDLVPWDGAGVEKVWLCGTCADNLSMLQHILHSNDGQVDWATRREFGNQIRALGLKGWNLYSGQVRGDG